MAGQAVTRQAAGRLAEQIPVLPGIDVVLPTTDRQPGDVAAELRQLLSVAGWLKPVKPRLRCGRGERLGRRERRVRGGRPWA